MASERYDNMDEIKRQAAQRSTPAHRHAEAAKDDMDYLEALQRESRRRTGQELSPELAAALILRRTALKSHLG